MLKIRKKSEKQRKKKKNDKNEICVMLFDDENRC